MAGEHANFLDWNPMSEAHNDPNFNSYDDGPGRHFQASGGASKDNCKLYVRNVPLEMTEDGLRNVFTTAGGAVPVRVTIPGSKGQYTTNFAFVNFTNPGEASRAIVVLHKTPPLYLDVIYQKPRIDTRNPPVRKYDTLAPRADSVPANQCPPPNPSGVIDWEGVRRAGYLDGRGQQQDRAWSDPKDAFVEPRRAGYYDPRGGASGVADLPHDLAFAVDLKISAGADGRRVSCGRGYFPPAPSASGPINSILGPYPFSNTTIARGPQVLALAAQTSPVKKLPVQMSPVQKLPVQTSPVQKPPAEPSTVRPLPCNSCYQPATNVCFLCRQVRYCSRECADKHWVAHKNSCLINCKPPGVMLAEKAVNQPTSTSTEPALPRSVPTTPVLVSAAPSDIVFNATVPAKSELPTQKPLSGHMQVSTLGIDEYEDLPLGEETEVTVAVPDGSLGWVVVDSRTDYSYEIVTAISECKGLAPIADPHEGDYVAAVFCSEWYRCRVMSTDPLTVFYLDYGNMEQVTLDQIRSLPAEFLKEHAQAVQICMLPSASGSRRSLVIGQKLRVCAVRKVDNVTHVRLPDDKDAAPKPASVDVPKPDTTPTAQLLSATLPVGVLSAVTVVGSAGNGGVWVNLVSSASALTDLLERLRQMVTTMPPAANITVGSLVVVTHLRTTYRAQVTSVGPAGLTVRLVDEGRDIIVDAQKVRLLPAEFLSLEAQAIEIHAKEGSLPLLSDLMEGAEIIVKPIGKVSSGATIVEVPGKPHVGLACHQQLQPLSKDQATKVYFASKENDEFYIQPTTSSLLLAEMLKELEVLHAASALKPCANIAVGQVALAKFENDWCRCKILSINKGIEIIFIDYGNKIIVAKDDMRELPEKYYHIPGQCVRVHFTCDTPAAVLKLPEFKVFLATLFAEASNGSLIINGTMIE